MANANTSGAIARITREIANAQKGTDLSIAVACTEEDVRHVRALIIGPPETPYEFGFFEFALKFPKDYPILSPNVKCITTNGGQTRFNPNIYADGKVCLSILGTWRGEPGEEWSSAQGLESVLLSIQSLMSANPYENEPGFERAKKDDEPSQRYVAKIQHETIHIAVIQNLERLLGITPPMTHPTSAVKKRRGNSSQAIAAASAEEEADDDDDDDESSSSSAETSESESAHEYDAEATYKVLEGKTWQPFADLMKQRFLWYYDTYIKRIFYRKLDQMDSTKFYLEVFECCQNGMDGMFQYKRLQERMEVIFKKLNEEKQTWAEAGLKHVQAESQLAVQLAFQFAQLQTKWNEGQYSGSRLELSLPEDRNAFVWNLVLFGEPLSNLDGGIFSATMHIPPDFPTTQPRVTFETPIFHHRVSSKGTLCYFAEKPDEIASHLEGISTLR